MRKLLALLVVLAGCHPVQDYSVVDSAVDLFHQRLASSEDDTIYRDAGVDFQRSIDLETNRKFLGQIRRRRGMPGRATRTSFDIQGAVVTAKYQTSFANGDATETFVWRLQDGKATLLGFTID
jgi:hypothetical protein